jgi:LCP family protein required for cell wall assembly
VPTPKPPTNRVTFLLTGVDSGHDRNHALTDTLLVVSIDTVDKTGVMISVPRDLGRLPLYSGGIFVPKINELLTTARNNPSKYPDGPMGTLTREIGFLIGMKIDYYAQINLEGFERMINLVGGVDVDNPKWINDPAYDWFDGTYGFSLSPGPHHLNGRLALAYVRSRMGVGDNDFTRARRQQQVIASLRDKMLQPAMLQKLPDLLKAAARTISTDFPADQVDDFVALGKEIGTDRVRTGIVLGPPYAYRPSTPSSTYYLLLDMEKVANLSIEVFGTDSDYYGLDTSAAP